jgi:hypothetical protein
MAHNKERVRATVFFNKGLFLDVPTMKKFENRADAENWVKHTVAEYKANKEVSMRGVKEPTIVSY